MLFDLSQVSSVVPFHAQIWAQRAMKKAKPITSTKIKNWPLNSIVDVFTKPIFSNEDDEHQDWPLVSVNQIRSSYYWSSSLQIDIRGHDESFKNIFLSQSAVCIADHISIEWAVNEVNQYFWAP